MLSKIGSKTNVLDHLMTFNIFIKCNIWRDYWTLHYHTLREPWGSFSLERIHSIYLLIDGCHFSGFGPAFWRYLDTFRLFGFPFESFIKTFFLETFSPGRCCTTKQIEALCASQTFWSVLWWEMIALSFIPSNAGSNFNQLLNFAFCIATNLIHHSCIVMSCGWALASFCWIEVR